MKKLSLLTPQVIFGEALIFELRLISTSKRPQPLIIDYVIHHRKANGKTSPKVFKWKTTAIAPLAALTAKRKHSIRNITTRVYYPGAHRLEIMVNGISIGVKTFDLAM